jgi:hypothetical protein
VLNASTKPNSCGVLATSFNASIILWVSFSQIKLFLIAVFKSVTVRSFLISFKSNKGYSIKELDNKTAQELARFHNNNSFKTIKIPTKPRIATDNLDDGRQTALDDITKEVNEYEPPTYDAKSKVTIRIDKP